MNVFRYLKQVRLALLLVLMYRLPNESPEASLKYNSLLWIGNVIWTMTIPLFFFLFYIKAIKGLMTEEDRQESTETVKRKLDIYAELSEYEWRNEVEICHRVNRKRAKDIHKTDDGLEIIVLNSDVDVHEYQVLGDLIVGENSLCLARQEDRPEYVERMLSETLRKMLIKEVKVRRLKMSDSITLTESQVADIRKVLELQFEAISKYGKGDHLKEFYLGRKFLFKKIPRGNKTIPPRNTILQT